MHAVRLRTLSPLRLVARCKVCWHALGLASSAALGYSWRELVLASFFLRAVSEADAETEGGWEARVVSAQK